MGKTKFQASVLGNWIQIGICCFSHYDAESLHSLWSDCHLSLSQVEVKGHEKVRPWSLKSSKEAAFPSQFRRGAWVSVMAVAAGTQKTLAR